MRLCWLDRFLAASWRGSRIEIGWLGPSKKWQTSSHQADMAGSGRSPPTLGLRLDARQAPALAEISARRFCTAQIKRKKN
jgi:hypothetical protein